MFTIVKPPIPPRAPDFVLGRSDLSPSLTLSTLEVTGALPIGATAKVQLRPRSGGAARSAPAYIRDHLAAVIEYNWQPIDTATAGDYDLVLRIIVDGRPLTFPIGLETDGITPRRYWLQITDNALIT